MIKCFNIVALDTILIFNFRPIITKNTFLNIEISENEENKKANPVNNPHPLYPLQKSCVHVYMVQYVFAYTFQLEQV